MRQAPVVALALVAALAIPAPAQNVTVPAQLQLRLDLETLSGGGETGWSAAWAVPEFAAMGRALAARGFETLVALRRCASIRDLTRVQLPWGEIESAQIGTVCYGMDGERPGLCTVVEFRAEAAGRAGALFDAEAARLERAGARLLRTTDGDAWRRFAVEGQPGLWLAQRGACLAEGSGELAVPPLEPADRGGGGSLTMTSMPVAAWANGDRDRAILTASGFDDSARAHWEIAVDGAGFRESFVVRGTLRASPRPKAPLAGKPMPSLAEPWLCARFAFEPAWLVGVLRVYLAQYLPSFDASVLTPLLERLDGRVGLSIGPPAIGRFVPRFGLVLGVRDGEALARELPERARSAVDRGFDVESDAAGLFVMWGKRSLPPTLRPCLAVEDGMVLLAETPSTLRSLRAGEQTCDDPFAGTTGKVAGVPEGSHQLGECWFDGAAIYRGAAAAWGTQLVMAALLPNLDSPLHQVASIVEPGDLPDPDDMAPAFGKGLAVFYVGADELGMRVDAPALGPVLTAAWATATAMVPRIVAMALEQRVRSAKVEATVARAQRLGEALVRYKERNGDRLPAAIGDLVPLLPAGDDEPLLAPHDPASLPLSVPGPDGKETEVQSSFQHPPVGMAFAPVARGREPVRLLRAPDRRELPVFAFCGGGYQGHHLVVRSNGDVAWIPSERLLKAILGERK